MPTFIAPSFSPNAAASTAAAGNGAGPRGRGAEESDGHSFNAVLNRSRHADAKAPPAEEASAADPVARRKPGRGGDRRDELPAEALPLAFFAPLIANALAKAPAALSADASVAATGLPPNGAPIETLAADAAATATDETKAAAAPEGDDPAKTAGAQAATDGAKPGATADAAAAAVQRAAEAPLPATPAAAANPNAAATAAAPSTDGAAPDAARASAGAAAAAPAASGAAREALLSSADDPAADAAPADPTVRGADLSAPSTAAPTTPAATAVLASHPFMPAAAARADAPQASVHVPTLSVEPSVGSEAWGRAIGQQMLRMSAAGYQVAELNLNPAGLGPLKVTLSLADNQAQAMFVSAHESVRRAVEAALPQLRSSMADSGISLGNASVGAESHPAPGQGGAFDQQPQQQRQQPGSPGPAGWPQAVAATDAVQSSPAAAPRRSAAGAVDTFA